MENNTNNTIVVNGKEYVKLNDTEAKEVENILASINMTLDMFYAMNEAAQKSVFSCAIETYKQNLEKAKSVKRVKVQKSIHWQSKTTVEVKCIKAFIQGFKYLAGFVQNNASLLNEYNNEGENVNLADIIEASIDKLLAENHSNFKKGSEKVKYSDADYQSVSLFISKLLKDKNADLYKWLLQSKLASYEKIVYTTKDKQADSKQA